VDALLSICEEHQVRLLVPQSDLDLALMAQHRKRFLAVGTLPVVSARRVVDICWDKWAAARFLARCGLRTPRTFLSPAEARQAVARRELQFPVVVKPRWGAASFGIHVAEDERELDLAYELLRISLRRSMLAAVSGADPDRTVIVQEHLSGQEHGLDVVNDLEGQHIATFARRKLGMRCGETERAVTVLDPEFEQIGAALGRGLRHIGNLDCDLFVEDGKCYVLEMNPRLGGGYPFSHLAGANLPAALVAWVEGREPDPRWFVIRPGVMAAKCDHLVVQEARAEPVPLATASAPLPAHARSAFRPEP